MHQPHLGNIRVAVVVFTLRHTNSGSSHPWLHGGLRYSASSGTNGLGRPSNGVGSQARRVCRDVGCQVSRVRSRCVSQSLVALLSCAVGASAIRS